MNAKEARAFLNESGVKYILAQFVDIHGVAKTKAVPMTHFAASYKYLLMTVTKGPDCAVI